jgi:hypothetical protein
MLFTNLPYGKSIITNNGSPVVIAICNTTVRVMETYLDGIRNTYGNQYPEVDTGFSGGY